MIKYLRGALVIFMFSFFGVCALILRYLVFPFQKSKSQNYETLYKSWKFFIWLTSVTKIINVKQDNLDKIKNIKNSIIVATHPSFIDVVVLMSIIPNSTCFVAQKLAKNPFFKGMVELLFVIDSDDMNEWINRSVKKLNEGLNLIIFPMGTRHTKDEHPRIKRGAALIAQKSKKNIVALDIQTSSKFLYINQPIYDAGNKTISYSIKYQGEINIKEYYENKSNEIDIRSRITKAIGKILYQN